MLYIRLVFFSLSSPSLLLSLFPSPIDIPTDRFAGPPLLVADRLCTTALGVSFVSRGGGAVESPPPPSITCQMDRESTVSLTSLTEEKSDLEDCTLTPPTWQNMVSVCAVVCDNLLF